jgi:RNA polymerase sigma factor (sigma-70 family)
MHAPTSDLVETQSPAPPFLAAPPERVFRDLVTSHRRRLYAFVLRNIGQPQDAEDLTQQAFVEAARSLATFRGEAALSTWLYGIAMNLVRNHLSRAPRRRYCFEDESALVDMPSNTAGPERQLESSQLATLLERGLDTLSAELREVLLLVAIDELSYQDAAVLLSLPIGTVRSRVSRARAALREHLTAAVGTRLLDSRAADEATPPGSNSEALAQRQESVPRSTSGPRSGCSQIADERRD